MSLRIGVVGTGSIGQRHIGNLLSHGCVVRAMDTDPEARTRAKREHVHASVSAFIDFEGLDGLVVATPLEHHLEWVEEAIRRDLPFFVEKPLGTMEQLPRWFEIAAMRLPVHAVGYNLRAFDGAKKLRNATRFGYPEMRFILSCDMSKWPGRYGDPLLECSHEIDLALWCGADYCVSSFEAGRSGFTMRLGDRCSVVVKTDAEAYERRWSIGEDVVRVGRPGDFKWSYDREMSGFLYGIRYGQQSQRAQYGLCDIEEAVRVLDVCARAKAMVAV